MSNYLKSLCFETHPVKNIEVVTGLTEHSEGQTVMRKPNSSSYG